MEIGALETQLATHFFADPAEDTLCAIMEEALQAWYGALRPRVIRFAFIRSAYCW